MASAGDTVSDITNDGNPDRRISVNTLESNGRDFVRISNMKKPLALIFLLAVFAVFAMACSDDDDSDPSVTPPPGDPTHTPVPEDPTATPTPEPEEGEAPEGLYGHGKRTGVPEIDAILEAWENGDIDALVALALLQEQECVTVLEGLGGPPECPDGVPPGTVVEVFQAAACEGYWVYPDGIADVLAGFIEGFEGDPYFLYAAWRSEGTEHEPAGYRLLFARTVTEFDTFSPQVFLDEDGKIFLYASGCNPAPVQVPIGADFIVEPRLGVPTGTGIPSVDNFLLMRDQHNAQGLVNHVVFFDVACKLLSEAEYYVHCPAGQPSGTPVQAWPWWGCHGAFSNAGTPEQIAEFFANEDGELKSVLRFTPSGSVDMFPVGANLAVVFERPDGFAWAAILDDNGSFYGMVSGCPTNAQELGDLHFAGAEMLYEAA
jgi:hypothetical protein